MPATRGHVAEKPRWPIHIGDHRVHSPIVVKIGKRHATILARDLKIYPSGSRYIFESSIPLWSRNTEFGSSGTLPSDSSSAGKWEFAVKTSLKPSLSKS